MNQLLRIGSNTQANLALRNLYRVNNKVAMHQERLSTGKRINSAKDDAAGFALAASLKERLSGMKIAKQNIQNAQSVLSIVEAGQQKSIELLQNMREKMLRVQDSTLTTDQRKSLLDQLTELKSELTDIYNSVKWNSSSTLADTTVTFQVGEESGDTFAVSASMVQGSDISAFASTSATASSADITAIDSQIEHGTTHACSFIDVDSLCQHAAIVGAKRAAAARPNFKISFAAEFIISIFSSLSMLIMPPFTPLIIASKNSR